VSVGPYPPASVAAITAIVKGGAPDATVTIDRGLSPAAAPQAVSPASNPRPAPASLVPPVSAPPAAAPPAPAGAGPQALPSNGLYTVRVGPLPERDRAAAIMRQLSAGGFPQAQTSGQPGYQVLSEPLPRKVAESLVATLAGRGLRAEMQALTGDTVQLLFGAFASQKDAEALSARIAAAGYDAWIREGTVYTVSVGPYPPASVAAITAIVKGGAPDAAVTIDPSR
jgi:cell division septation protein DedD